MSNAAHLSGPAVWLNFRRVLCERWAYDKIILLGDSAHTAHFSIGSGTKLALEDAIKLAEVLNRPGLSRAAALDEYQAERTVEVLKLQNSARNSTEWRSEEHTSELQSLMRISYAVLGLKKKNKR